MQPYDLVLRARRAVLPTGVASVCVGVSGRQVAGLTAYDDVPLARRMVELAEDEVLMPGLVDTHVHLQNPGHAEWEDVAAATREALLGGVTTLVDMPVDCDPPTVDPAALQAKCDDLNGRVFTDVGFWGGVVPGNLGCLGSLADAGVLGFKAFLGDPGLPQFEALSTELLGVALAELVPYGLPLLVHAEDAHGSEVAAVRDVVAQATATGGWAHVVHVSDPASLAVISAARRDGTRVTAETCPHYLAPPDADVITSPPVLGMLAAQALWAGLEAGSLDLVVSDHSPGLEAGGPPGVAAMHLRLPVVWTALAARGLGLEDLVRWCCLEPARLAGLLGKGRIEVGADADLCVLAPESQVVAGGRRVTPYDGVRLLGEVRGVWLRGVAADESPRGRLLLRGAA